MNNFYPTICRKLLLGVVLTASLHPAAIAQNIGSMGHSIASNPPNHNQTRTKKAKSLIDALSQISSFYKVGFNYDSDKLEGKNSQEAATLNLSKKSKNLEEVLDALLTPQGFGYEKLRNNLYLIYSKKEPQNSSKLQEGAQLNTGGLSQKIAIDLTGKVTDDTGQPLPGVSILIKGTSNGTATNTDGTFSLSVPDQNAVLVFSFIGYKSQEVAVNNRTQINVTLATDATQLEEVIVVGASLRQEDLTGAVGRVSEKTLEERPVTSLNEALQGRVAGVNIQTSAEPGANAGIKVRGTNSMQYGGNPIYVVDGVIMERDFNMINLNDIASVNVLKDASSTALYGSRGANGVVVITTKKGQKGVGSVSYDGWFGLQSFTNENLTLGAKDMYELRMEALENSASVGGKYYQEHPNATRQDFQRDELFGPGKLWFAGYETESYNNGRNYNWLKEVTRQALQQNHNVSFSGGTDKGSYYLSFGLADQQGIVKSSGFKRYTGRINADQSIKPWLKIGTNTSFARTTEDLVHESVFGVARGANPLLPINTDSLKMAWGNNWDINSANPINSLRIARDRVKNRLFSNTYINVNPIEGLNFRSSLSADIIHQEYNEYIPSDIQQSIRESFRGRATNNIDNVFNFQWDNSVSYEKQFGIHRIAAFVATNMSRNRFNYTNISAFDFPTDDFGYHNLGAAFDKERFALGSSYTASSLMSYVVRANYDYENKYFVTVTGRYDGSSKFAPGYKWGLFPSVALAWNIANENFMKDQTTFSNLKLRTGYGTVGNQGIPDYGFYSLYNPAYSNGAVSYNSTGTRGTRDLTWEKQKQLNVGIDVGILNNRITFTADYFNIVNSNLLMRRSLSTISGFNNALVNIGEMTNKGVEFTVNASVVEANDFKWNVSGNISRDNNKVTKLYGDVDAIYSYGGFTNTDIQREGNFFLGHSVNTIYMWEFDRIVQQSDMDYVNSLVLPGKTVQPGDILPKDQQAEGEEGHGVIDENDRIIIGKKDPKFYGGFSSEFAWKGLSLNTVFTYSYGGKAVSGYYEGLMSGTGYGPAHTDMLDRWTPTNTDTNIPRATYDNGARFSSGETSWSIQNSSFLRLSTLTLAYNFPKVITQKIGFSNLRVYASGTNLLLVSKYKGYDPENGDAYPTAKSLVFGINFGF